MINDNINPYFCQIQFDLVCDREWMQTLGSTAYMFGMLFGGIFLGNLADM